MGLIKWYADATAGDCLDSVGTWNDMIDYIKHSACTDFTIHSECTDTGQAFRFTQTGTLSEMYGGADTGDDLQILANDTDIYPYIKLLGDGDAEIWVANNDFLWFYEGGIKAIRFSADSNDSQIRGRDNTLGHLSLWANTIDAYPYIKLDGGGNIEVHADLNDEIIFYEQANERFRFEEHQIDFNADRAIYINDDNTFLGHGAGDNIGAGTNNTFAGHDVMQANNVSGCVGLGYSAGLNNATSNRLYINNSNSVFPLIYGEFDNNVVKIGNNSDKFGLIFDVNTATKGKIYGGNTNGCDLIMKCNTVNPFPCIELHGGQDIKIYSDTGGGNVGRIRIYENVEFLNIYRASSTAVIESMFGNDDLWLKTPGSGLVKFGTETVNAGSDRGKLIAMKTAAGTTVYLKTYDTV